MWMFYVRLQTDYSTIKTFISGANGQNPVWYKHEKIPTINIIFFVSKYKQILNVKSILNPLNWMKPNKLIIKLSNLSPYIYSYQ